MTQCLHMKRLDFVTVYFAHCPVSTFWSHITLPTAQELGGETKSLLTPDVVKLSHNGNSDAQASVYLCVSQLHTDYNTTSIYEVQMTRFYNEIIKK